MGITTAQEAQKNGPFVSPIISIVFFESTEAPNKILDD